jgi:hypothetical protein
VSATPRLCRYCKAPLVQNKSEGPKYFAKRQYCSNACSAADRHGREVSPYLLYPELPILPGEELSYRDIGALLGLSHASVQRIEANALAKLKGLVG